MTAATTVIVPEVEPEPMPFDPMADLLARPLYTSTALFDLCPDRSRDPLCRDVPIEIWASERIRGAYRRDWHRYVDEIHRNLPAVGVALRTVKIVDFPSVILLGRWGDIRLISDDRGPRILIRICVPTLMGAVVSFQNPDFAATFDRIMEHVRHARCRSRGASKPTCTPSRPTTWKGRIFPMDGEIAVSEALGWY